MSQTIANVNSNLDEIENIFDNVVNINQNTLNNRNIRSGSIPPLRQRQRDENLRLEIGKKQTKINDAEIIEPPTLEEQQQQELEMELGGSMVPLTEEDIREEIITDRTMRGDFTEPTQQEVLDRLAQAQEAAIVSQMPTVPREDIQVRTEQDIMEGLRN